MKRAQTPVSISKFKLMSLTLFGETKLLTEWVKDPRCDVSYTTLRERFIKGWPHEPPILAYDPRNYAGKRQFRALLPDGSYLGDFGTIAKATEAIKELSETGSIEWLFRGTVIPVPRPHTGSGRGRGQVMLTAWGETKTAGEWAKDSRCLVSQTTLYNRVRQKRKVWSAESAMTTPPKELYVSSRTLANTKQYTAYGEKKTLPEWTRDPRCKVKIGLLRRRIREGMELERAITKPADPRWEGRAADPPKLEAFGESKSVIEWSRDPRCKVSGYEVLRRRVLNGMPLEEALIRPPDSHLLRGTAFGETKTLREWAKDPRCQVSMQQLRHRVTAGMPLEKALSFQREISVEAFGESKTLKQWADDPRCQVSKYVLWSRLRDGTPPEAALLLKQDDSHRLLAAFGERKTLILWLGDPRLKVSPAILLERIAAGKALEDAMTRA